MLAAVVLGAVAMETGRKAGQLKDPEAGRLSTGARVFGRGANEIDVTRSSSLRCTAGGAVGVGIIGANET